MQSTTKLLKYDTSIANSGFVVTTAAVALILLLATAGLHPQAAFRYIVQDAFGQLSSSPSSSSITVSTGEQQQQDLPDILGASPIPQTPQAIVDLVNNLNQSGDFRDETTLVHLNTEANRYTLLMVTEDASYNEMLLAEEAVSQMATNAGFTLLAYDFTINGNLVLIMLQTQELEGTAETATSGTTTAATGGGTTTTDTDLDGTPDPVGPNGTTPQQPPSTTPPPATPPPATPPPDDTTTPPPDDTTTPPPADDGEDGGDNDGGDNDGGDNDNPDNEQPSDGEEDQADDMATSVES